MPKKKINIMQHKFIFIFCLVLIYSGLFSQTKKDVFNPKKIAIGMIGRIAANPVFIASYAGANAAAKELGEKYKVEISVSLNTPDEENVEKQAAAIEQFSHAGIDGIDISCSDANYLTNIIDAAVDKGIPVVCFDSDAPKSKRFAFYGADDYEFGKMLIKELANELNDKGTIAILAGNKNAINLQHRLQGIKDEVKKHPKISLLPDNIYYNIDVPVIASELVAREEKNHPDIVGWIFLTSSALQVKNSLKWNSGQVKVVAGNAEPAELEFIKSGHVQSLVGINSFQMGYKSVEILVDKILFKHNPKDQIIYLPLTPVSKRNIEEWLANWKKWLIKDALYH